MSEQPLPQADVLASPEQADPLLLGSSAMGGVSVETTPQPSEFTRMATGLSDLTARLAQDKRRGQYYKFEAIEGYLADHRVDEAIQGGNYTTEEFSHFVQAIADVDARMNYSLTPVLAKANRSALDELYRNRDKNLIFLLDREMSYARNNPDHYYLNSASIIESIVQGVDGRMIDWARRANGKDPADPARNTWPHKELMNDPRFPTACAKSEFNKINEESVGNSSQDQLKVRDAETDLLEAFGVPAHISKDIRRSLRSRTLVRKGDPADPKDIGGIDKDRWIANVGDYCQNIRALENSEVETLHRVCGLVNLDRYNSRMLHNQIRFLERLSGGQGPEIPKDITVVFTDAFGDYNGSANNVFKGYDPKSTLVFEIHKLEDIKRYQALIKQMNIKPSTLVLFTHGGRGELGYNEGPDEFVLVSHQLTLTNEVHIDKTELGRFIAEDMQPNSASGEREIVLYACYGAEGLKGEDSIAEAIIKQTEPKDKAVVKAARESITASDWAVAGGEVFVKARRSNYRSRLSNYVRRLGGRPARNWEIAQTIEHRRGTRPGEVIKSRPAKKTLVRRRQYA